MTDYNTVSSKRILVKYAEDGGAKKDGIIEIRPDVKYLDLGYNGHRKAQYRQVKINIDRCWYIKGMAMYSDDIPDGYDIVYYTSKSSKTPLMVNKKDPENTIFKIRDSLDDILMGSIPMDFTDIPDFTGLTRSLEEKRKTEEYNRGFADCMKMCTEFIKALCELKKEV